MLPGTNNNNVKHYSTKTVDAEVTNNSKSHYTKVTHEAKSIYENVCSYYHSQ